MLRNAPVYSIPNYSKASGVFSSCCRKAASSPPLYFHQANPRDSSQLIIPFVRVWTYQTRNFASCQSTHRCAERTLSSNKHRLFVWRVVSGDSLKVVNDVLFFVFPLPSLSFVKFFSQFNDSHKPLASKMLSGVYDHRNLFEQREVSGFGFGLKRKPLKEREYLFYEFDVICHHKVMDSITSSL